MKNNQQLGPKTSFTELPLVERQEKRIRAVCREKVINKWIRKAKLWLKGDEMRGR